MVGPPPPHARLARGTWRNARSLPGLALRSAAAADDGAGGDALLSDLHCEMAAGRGPGRRPARGRDERVRGSRLLFARAKPARLRQGNRSTGRTISKRGSRPARASRRWRLYRGRGRGDRLWPPDRARRWQHRPHSGAAPCCGKADRSRARRTSRGGARAGAKPQGGRFRSGADGHRGNPLPASQSRLQLLSARRRLRGVPRRSPGGLSPAAPRRRRDRAGRARFSSPAVPTALFSLAAARRLVFSPRRSSCRARRGPREARAKRFRAPLRSSRTGADCPAKSNRSSPISR